MTEQMEQLWSRYLAAGGAADATAFGVWLIREQPRLSASGKPAAAVPPKVAPSPQQLTGILIARLHRLFALAGKATLRSAGLAGADDLSVLATLLFMGRSTKSELLRQCLLESAAGSLLLKRLRADSLLREEANPDDGRSSFVVLTPKGHALLLAALKALAGPTDPLAVLDAAERTQLSALLDKIDAAQSPLHQLRPLKDLLGPRG